MMSLRRRFVDDKIKPKFRLRFVRICFVFIFHIFVSFIILFGTIKRQKNESNRSQTFFNA